MREGGVTGLWAGVTPSLWRTVPGVGIYFLLFHKAAGGKTLGTTEALVVGGLTRVAAGTLLIPVTVVKTRWEARGADRQEGLGKALRGLAKGEGLKGLAAGLVPTLLRDAPYSALYLAAYTTLQKLLPAQESAVQGDRIAAALLAGLAATTVVCVIPRNVCYQTKPLLFTKVHPADVLKTRLQLPGAKPGLLRAAEAVWEDRGVKGFLAGIGPRLVGEIYFGNMYIYC